MPDSHALWKLKVVQILQTYAVFKRNIIKSSMFEAPLILALGIYTSNPCKRNISEFLYGFLVHLPEHMTIACEPFWHNLSNSYYIHFQEVPRNIYISESQFILRKGNLVSVSESSRKCTCCLSICFQNWRNGMWHYRKAVNDSGDI